MMMNNESREMKKVSIPEPDDKLSGQRREFLKNVLAGTVSATVLMVYGPGVMASGGKMVLPEGDGIPKAEHHWIYVVDVGKCIGCGNCVRACKRENNVPNDVFRTWVERYVTTKEGVYVESPNGALEGFGEVNEEIRKQAKNSFTVPKLCNHCHQPPCVQVCPVGATFKAPEGFVLVDWEHCIGCGYCVQACPYAARFINPEEHKADKCSWCYHRVKAGMRPACVTVCPNKARLWGDMRDNEAEVTQIFEEGKWIILKPYMTTYPACFYVGMPKGGAS